MWAHEPHPGAALRRIPGDGLAAAGGELLPRRKPMAPVQQHFGSGPEDADAVTGAKALQRLQVVREVEAAPNPAKDLRPRSAEPFKGTRWSALFVPAAATPGKSDSRPAVMVADAAAPRHGRRGSRAAISAAASVSSVLAAACSRACRRRSSRARLR